MRGDPVRFNLHELRSGRADGVASALRFSGPQAVAVGEDGTLWVADTMNHRIRKGVLQERR